MDFSHYFHNRIKKSLDEDRAEILAGFREILKSGATPKFRLASYYKGLPISYPATIVELNGDTLELDVHQQQAVAIERVRRVFIKCDDFDRAILADVKNANVRKMTASLKNFTFVEIMAERRDALRLELEPPTQAEITYGGMKIRGNLFDLSLGGFSVKTEEHCPLGKDVEVKVRVMLPNLLQNTFICIETTASHIETIKRETACICRFSFTNHSQTEAEISRFIFQRQVEIIREIKEAS
jgi:hypothetical protein